MRNVLNIDTTKHCNCDCVSSIDDKTNLIVLAIKVGDVENPTVHIYVDDYNTENAPLMKNVENIFLLPYEHFKTATTIKVIYEDSTHRSDVFTFKFGDNRTGEMMVHMVDNFNYNVTFKQAGTGGGGSAYELPPATTNRLGGVIVGDGLTVDVIGRVNANKQTDNNYTDTQKAKLEGIEANANKYELPPSSKTSLGGVIVGTGLQIDGSGLLSVMPIGNVLVSEVIYPYTEFTGGLFVDNVSRTDTLTMEASIDDYDLVQIMYTAEGGYYKPTQKWNVPYMLNVHEYNGGELCLNVPPTDSTSWFSQSRVSLENDKLNVHMHYRGGFTKTYFKVVGMKIVGNHEAKSFKYDGTGLYGEENPVVLNFDFPPNFVRISGYEGVDDLKNNVSFTRFDDYCVGVYGYVGNNAGGFSALKLQWSDDGKQCQFYSKVNEGSQLNFLGSEYTVTYF